MAFFYYWELLFSVRNFLKNGGLIGTDNFFHIPNMLL
jgi:hypothetical protein